MSGCDHALKDLLVHVDKYYECIGLKFCIKCRKIFKETLQEIKW